GLVPGPCLAFGPERERGRTELHCETPLPRSLSGLTLTPSTPARLEGACGATPVGRGERGGRKHRARSREAQRHNSSREARGVSRASRPPHPLPRLLQPLTFLPAHTPQAHRLTRYRGDDEPRGLSPKGCKNSSAACTAATLSTPSPAIVGDELRPA